MTDDFRLLCAYEQTRWRVLLPNGLVVLGLDAPAPLLLRGAGIITGWNPASEIRSLAANEEANRALRQSLEEAGATLFPTVAGEGAWEEPGFAAVDLGREVLVRFGARWEQNAVVWFDETGRASLVVTRSGFCGRRIGDAVTPFTSA